MYKVLFPDDDDTDMPSPCESQTHQSDQLPSANRPAVDHPLGSDTTWESRREQEFDNYERYLRRELPRLVRQQLETAASEFSAPLENQLRGQLIEIVRDAQSQLFRQYRCTDPTAADPRAASSRGLVPESRQESAITGLELQDINGSGAGLVDFDFSAFFQQPLVDENHVNPMDVFTEPLSAAFGGDLRAVSDSGYGSMGLPAESDCAESSNNFSSEMMF
jgi:hypothetical protein